MVTATTITRIAPAKVNLCLRIVGKRSDGYHLLDSVFAAIDLGDRLTISVEPRENDATRTALICDYPGIPADDSNLAVRAVTAFAEVTNARLHVRISIDKRIPPGAGLGGGSSDAAAVLLALNAITDSKLSHAELSEIALSLGADVPFFLTAGCARVRGVGEHVDPIPGWPGQELIVVLPPLSVSTAWAFRNYLAGLHAEADEPARLAGSSHLEASWLCNDLEAVVLPAHPDVAVAKRALLDAGAMAAVMSGSGAAVVGVCSPTMPAERVRAAFAAALPQMAVHLVHILSPTR